MIYRIRSVRPRGVETEVDSVNLTIGFASLTPQARRSWIPRFDNPAPGSVNAHSLMPRWLGFLTLAGAAAAAETVDACLRNL